MAVIGSNRYAQRRAGKTFKRTLAEVIRDMNAWYSNSLNCIILVETTHLTQVEYYISLADVRSFTFVLS